MNKKRFLIFLSVVLLLSIALIFLLRGPAQPAFTILKAQGEEDVRLFYYRAVPGLKQAEEMDLLVALNQTFALPGTKAKLVIDRIWYHPQGVVLFYHVEDMDTPAYLGGDLYLADKEPDKKTVFWGPKSIGRSNEEGILYRDGFYSCVTLSPLKDTRERVLAEVEHLMYKPFLTILDSTENKKAEQKIVSLKAFEIELNYAANQEPIQKISLSSQLEFDSKRMVFYQTNLSPSAFKVYFQFLNSGRDRIVRMQGQYKTNKGENHTFDIEPALMTGYPYHYVILLPPFHVVPDSITLSVDTMDLIGSDKISFEIDTKAYGGNKKDHTINRSLETLRNTFISLEKINLDRETAEIHLGLSYSGLPLEPHTRLNILHPFASGSYPFYVLPGQDAVEPANILTIRNQNFVYYDFKALPFGYALNPGAFLRLQIDRGYYNDSDTLHVELKNLSYRYEVHRSIDLKLIQ